MRADKRYEIGMGYKSDRDFVAACDLFAQCLELAPSFKPCLAAYGESLTGCGLDSQAKQIYAQLILLDPADLFGGRLALARLESRVTDMTPDYVASLFDDYAPRFEKALVEDLHYVAPHLLYEAVQPVTGAVLDLGCGTGLMGEWLAPHTSSLIGVDLSSDMVALAREKKLYNALYVGELVQFMQTQTLASFDLVIAADVFVYLGDLQAAFQESARVLPVGGLLAFTAQACDEGFCLGDDWRYAHSEEVLRAWLAPSFHVKRCDAITPRYNKDQPVRGWLVVAQKR
jgi:predicted TPR repeat methyltransferase